MDNNMLLQYLYKLIGEVDKEAMGGKILKITVDRRTWGYFKALEIEHYGKSTQSIFSSNYNKMEVFGIEFEKGEL